MSQSINAIFQAGLQHVLAPHRGNEIVLIGGQRCQSIEAGHFLHRFTLSDYPAVAGAQVDYAQLPLASSSVDCAVVWQIVDRAKYWRQYIHELARIVRSEGYVIMVNCSGCHYHSAAMIQLIADHYGLSRVRCCRLHQWSKPPFGVLQQCLSILPGIGIGYVVVYQRSDVGLTPLQGLWVRPKVKTVAN